MTAIHRMVAALVTTFFLAAPLDAGVVIDNFDLPTRPNVVTLGNSPNIGTPASGVFDSRSVSVTGPGAISTVGGGLLTALKAAPVGTNSVTIGYTGPGFAFANNEYLVLHFLSSSGPLLGNISLSAAFNGAATAVVDASLPAIAAPDKIMIPLLAIPIVGTLASVTSLTLSFDLVGAASNFSLTALTTAVPEPSSIVAWSALAACAVVGVFAVETFQRRKRSPI